MSSESKSKLGAELRAIADRANNHERVRAYQAKLDVMRKAVDEVILPALKESRQAELGKYEMYFANKACGWDYLWFTYNDTTKNEFMKALEAELEKHDLGVRYHVDGACNHWDRDSIEGIFVTW